jgi:hypothetical protein
LGRSAERRGLQQKEKQPRQWVAHESSVAAGLPAADRVASDDTLAHPRRLD